MRSLSGVVWSEGMHLGPHHFQAQARYFEDLIHFTAAHLDFERWGLIGCQFDQEAVRNGTLSLVHARGVLPDGLPFDMPGADPLPEPRRIDDVFPPTRTTLGVMLAIPPRRPDGLNCALNGKGAGNARYVAEQRPMVDEGTGRDERGVGMGRKNISLLLDSELSEDLVTLPACRVMRDGSGHFVLDPSFIPPSLQLVASSRLMDLVRGLIELLDAKSSTLSQGRMPKPGSAAGFSAQEIANAWLTHSVNSSLAALRHLWAVKQTHPERLYVELSRLGGALCTFALESHPRQLPLYDHWNLSECFEALDRHIRSHLEMIVPTNCVSIPLRKTGPYLYQGTITDQRVLDRSHWIFSIRSPVGEVELIGKTPELVKVCSQEFIEKLVSRALPGMTLTHMSSPPAAVAPRLEVQYFSIDKAGPCWNHLMKTREIGVYVPGDLPEPEIELLVVLEF